MSDNVNNPAHYNAGSVETIDGIRAALGEGFADYCKGNVLKYVWRCGKKGDGVEDLRKAAKYLQWAIEAMEGNCPAIPDSSDRKPLAIPDGWRELEPDEVPLATDMHEWMGGWFFRNDDATHEYCWYSNRHIRKIETANPSETPNSSTWTPKVGDKVRVIRPDRISTGMDGVIVEQTGSEYAVRMSNANLTSFNLKANYLELIEAAS